jgi:hypothetical protein
MRKVPVLALGLLAALARPAGALELKNARAAYGFLSSPRADNKYLPGDRLNFVFEIAGLKTDLKTGVAKVQQTMEVRQGTKVVFKQDPMEMEVPLFGATRMPSFVQVVMTRDQKPGAYTLRVSVTDKLAKATKSLDYDFRLLKEGFGLVQPFTPSVAFVNQDFFTVRYSVVGMSRDKKTKMPDVEIKMRVLDKSGEPLVPTPVTNNVKDLHIDQVFDITKMSVIPIELPLVLNRAGTFTIEVKATDRLAKETVTMRLPLTVVDPSPYLEQAKVRPAE